LISIFDTVNGLSVFNKKIILLFPLFSSGIFYVQKNRNKLSNVAANTIALFLSFIGKVFPIPEARAIFAWVVLFIAFAVLIYQAHQLWWHI